MVVPLKDKKVVSIVNAFQSILIDIIYDIINYRTIKIKPIDVKDNTYINTDKEVNDTDPKLRVGDHVRISKYEHIFV